MKPCAHPRPHRSHDFRPECKNLAGNGSQPFAMWGFSPYDSGCLRRGKVYSITLSGEENRSGTYTQHFSLCRTLSLVTPVTSSPFIRGADFLLSMIDGSREKVVYVDGNNRRGCNLLDWLRARPPGRRSGEWLLFEANGFRWSQLLNTSTNGLI
jgi:hypothetical protein